MDGTKAGTDVGRFKVIIVGAGVTGLYLAHAFAKADMDYVVLDKHPVAPAWGSSISLYPSGGRILDQVGLYDVLDAKKAEMRDFHLRGPDGQTYASAPFIKEFSDCGGYLVMTFERRVFLQALYDELPDKSKVIEHARVSGIVEEEGGRVRVSLTDGGVHEGDVVIGCDGIHSAVRELLWERAQRLCPGLITVEEKQRITATYTCLTGIAPYQPGGVGGQAMSSASFDGFSFLFLTQPDHVYFFVFIRNLPGGDGGNGSKCKGASKYPNRLRFTDADADAVAARVLDCPVSETLGVLSHWFLGRTALCGDSAHKVTPNAGFGGNLGLEGAVVLANEIYAAVEEAKQQKGKKNQKPTDEAIRRAFSNYQEAQRPRAKHLYNLSWIWTRMQAYDGWGWYIAQRWILPQIAAFMAVAPKLSFVPFHQRSGKVPWEKQKWELSEEKTRSQTTSLRKTGPGLSGLMALIVISVFILLSYSVGAWSLGRHVKTSVHWGDNITV
ncbi:FAD-dependent monooxygenase [Apiospora saccharicola]|uniref:FAD-dependent monooxygenase n=1 Tax=Apiospora saccharicola TaxID=335842 RepID=A0ABR1U2P3_9PEZI